MQKKIVAILLLSIAITAQAGFIDGNTLVKYMAQWEIAAAKNPSADFMSAGEYRGYLLGVVDLSDQILFCTPDNSNARQLGAVVAAYLKANPARWSEPAQKLVIAALAQSFPCKK
ncbi:MAG: hypothetical protein EXR84_14405 [Gammaproteobacteria bacterium]|nr:hypothetical protein [Gammaproteobacteria bacterium]